MPGPKMGARPADFDEQLIRQSPTFHRWTQLPNGEKLRYACREFVKGQGDEEERLMRRIMIARRNNLKDHQTLKRARQLISTATGTIMEDGSTAAAAAAAAADSSPNEKNHSQPNDGGGNGDDADAGAGEEESASGDSELMMAPQAPAAKVPKTEAKSSSKSATTTTTTTVRRRRPSTLFSDAEVAKEMDVVAVEATRSYKNWLALEDGAVFVYNQKYIKGHEGHDWLLRKNIWRRMRYRRENKKMVETLIRNVHPPPHPSQNSSSSSSGGVADANGTNRHHDPAAAASSVSVASQIIDQTLLHSSSSAKGDAISHTDHNNYDGEAGSGGDATATARTAAETENDDMIEAVEAAVKVAESYTQSDHYKNNAMVHNHRMDDEAAAASSAALDAAARLAAATSSVDEEAVAAATAAANI